MATLTQGYTFGASETVTNAKLHSLVTGATFNNLVNADIDAAAAIAYSKLNLTGSIVNADISAAAAIAYSKLNLATSIVNADVSGSAAIAYSKLNLTGGIVNADVSGSAAIAYSKLALTNSLVAGDLTTGSVTGAKIAMGSDARGDILFRNATVYARLGAGTAGQVLRTEGAAADPTWGYPAGLTIASQAQGDVLYYNGSAWVRLAAGTSGQFLKTQGTGANPTWDTISTTQNVTLEAVSDAEATTTSTSTADLKTLSSLSIAVTKPILITVNTRKTTGAAADFYIGLKINGTLVTECRASSATNAVESGVIRFWIAPRRTDYARAGSAESQSTTGYQTAAWSADMPIATITSLTITGKSGSSSVTIGVADVKVYSYAGA